MSSFSESPPLKEVGVIHRENRNDILEFIELQDDSVMFNNDLHWESETPSKPTRDAIDRINDRLKQSAKIIKYQNQEIKEFYAKLLKRGDLKIAITLKNMITIFYAWKDTMQFVGEIKNEQTLINLFLIDIIKGDEYKKEDSEKYKKGESRSLFPELEEKFLMREGTNLNAFIVKELDDEQVVEFKDTQVRELIDATGQKVMGRITFTILNLQNYRAFWDKYKRPPAPQECSKILEESHLLYTDKYRKDTGGEYTPFFFVSEQNKILEKYCEDSKTSLKDYIIYDPCCGVGNLQNQFPKEIKAQCYLSTLDSKDVDICKIKDFENVVQFDYLANDKEPKFTHGGAKLSISEIVKREKKKLMVIMNPPYQRQKGKENKAISFFNKVLKLEPEMLVFYYMTESFMRDEVSHYINSKLKIYSHIFTTAKNFNLSDWSISQIIFSKNLGKKISSKAFTTTRYEKDKIGFNPVKSYTYDLKRPSLVKEIDKMIKDNQKGMVLGNYSYFNNTINLANKPSSNQTPITTENLKYCLFSKGLIFNTHNHYFERNQYVLKGKISEIPQVLFNNALMFSLFFKNCAFTNKAIASNGGG